MNYWAILFHHINIVDPLDHPSAMSPSVTNITPILGVPGSSTASRTKEVHHVYETELEASLSFSVCL